MMKRVFVLYVLLLAAAGSAMAAPPKVRVLLWSEQTEPRDVYPKGINGALADYLRQFPDVEVKTAGLNDADAGLSEAALAQTDVLIWFDHRRRGDVPDEAVDRIVKHVRERGMGFIGLHSAHHSKPIKRLLDATGSWSSYVNHGQPERMWVVLPGHPIAEGVSDFTIPQTEIYTEPFEVPQPEAVIIEGTWPSGHRSRDVMTWSVGKGRVVYIRAGHETYPIYFMPPMQRLVSNSVRYAAGRTHAPHDLKRREAGPPATEHGAYFKRELLLVANRLDDRVDMLDGATGEKVGSVKTGAHPHEVAMSPDASTAYVSLHGTADDGDNKAAGDGLAAINLKTQSREPIALGSCKAPHAMAVDVMGVLWVTCEGDGAVMAIDPNQKKIVAEVRTGSKGTRWISMLPDASKIYVSNIGAAKLSVIDRLARKVVKDIATPRGVEGITLSPDGKRLYAADSREPVLWVIDTEHDEVVRQVPLKNAPRRVRVVSASQKILITNYTSNTVEVLDLATLASEKVVPVGKSPNAISLSADGRWAFISNSGESTLSVIDLKTFEVARPIKVGNGPAGMSYVLTR
jgi:YVTN family beta-propeller protein